MKFSLVTPERKMETDLEVDEIIVPADKGELNILPNHSPLVSTLDSGILRYRKKGQSEFFKAVISWGYVEVTPEGVNVIAETAETKKILDKQRAETAVKKASNELSSGKLDAEEILKYQRKLKRSQARLQLLSE